MGGGLAVFSNFAISASPVNARITSPLHPQLEERKRTYKSVLTMGLSADHPKARDGNRGSVRRELPEYRHGGFRHFYIIEASRRSRFTNRSFRRYYVYGDRWSVPSNARYVTPPIPRVKVVSV